MVGAHSEVVGQPSRDLGKCDVLVLLSYPLDPVIAHALAEDVGSLVELLEESPFNFMRS